MAVETSAVEIRINVTDANSGAVIAGVEQNMQKLGAAGATTGSKMKQGLDGVGSAGANAGKQMKKGLDEGAAGARTAHRNVHLLTEEFDIHLPRAFKNMIAHCKTAQAVLGSLSGVLMGIGAIQIGAIFFDAAIEGAKKLWHNVLNVNQAVEDYQAETAKARQEDFGNTQSIETTMLRINEATEAVKRYENEVASQQQKAQFWQSPLAQVGNVIPGFNLGMSIYHTHKAHDAQGSAMDQQRSLDKLKNDRLAGQRHEERLRAIELKHAKDAALSSDRKRGEALSPRAAAELQETYEKNAEARSWKNLQDAAHGNPVDWKKGGEKEEAASNKIARDHAVAEAQSQDAEKAKAAAEKAAHQAQAQAQELARIHEEALESGLHGSALYHAQEAAAIEDLKRRGIATAQAIEDVQTKFHNQEMNRLRAQQEETARMGRAAAMAGMTGIQRTQAEGAGKIADLNADENLDPAERAKRIAYIQQETDQQIIAEQRTFNEEINTLADASTERQVQGFARIHAEAAKELDGLQKKFDAVYGHMDRSTPGGAAQYQQGLAQLHTGQGLIASGEAGQTAELARKNEQETKQIEALARAKSLNAERQQTAAIETEYKARVNKYREELKQREISENDFNRRVTAAAQLRDTEIVESSRQAREKMAGEFSRLMQNPTGTLKEMGNKAAGEMAAALMQRVQGRSGGQMGLPGMEQWGASFFDRIAGVPHGENTPETEAGAPRGKHGAPASIGASAMATPKIIAVSTAQIQIGTASIAMGVTTTSAAPSSNYAMNGAAGAALPGNASAAANGAPGAALSTTTAAAPAISAAGSAGGAGAAGNAVGLAQQSLSVTKQAKSLLSSSKTNAGMLGGGGVRANAEGAVSGGMGLYSAYESAGGAGGALTGAMSGMEMGMAVAGPMGAAVGAIGGAVLGAFGFGGRAKAEAYDKKTVRPRLADDRTSYQQGSMDYLSAYSDAESLQTEAQKTTSAWGPGARGYFNDTIKPEIKKAEAKLTAEQRAGRSMYTVSAAQYDFGGPIDNFGTLATTPGHGWIHAEEGEFMVEQQAAQSHSTALAAINAGATPADMAAYYGGGKSGTMPVQSASMGDVHLHVHAIDAAGVANFLDKYKHNIRSAVNDSYAENSGGGL